MAYIGNQPASAFASTEKQTITGNGTTGPYALTHEVSAATDIACFVNNVRQEPGVAYTVSGNQMTMTGNVASTDDFYVVYIGRVVGTVAHPANSGLAATSGTFSGAVSATSGTFSGAVSATDGTFTGDITMTSDDPTITMSDSSGTNDIATIQATSGALIVTARDGSADGEIIFKKTDGSATDETMRINSSGNVGIGTNNPVKRLTVDGGADYNVVLRSASTRSGLVMHTPGTGALGGPAASALLLTDNTFRLGTTNHYNLIMDQSGRVTVPQQPLFAVTGPASNNTYNTSPISNYLTAVRYNRGGHYHTTGANAGKFIAPIAGTYLFEWGMFINSAQTFRVQLVVNGGAITNPYISGHNAGMGSGHAMPVGHQIINLAANDSVQIGINGSAYLYGGHTGFAGYLLG